MGSAWTGKETNNTGSSKVVPGASESDSWILDLARKQRMNTDLRKSVFSIIVTSEDYIDAFEKLQRLGLKDVQEREIIHVLVDCCLREKAFNPYYAYLGQKLCEFKRSNQVTFQYTIWDRLKTLSSLPRSSMDNLWKLLSHLVSSKALSLGVLRVVEFSEMDKVGLYFFRKLLTSILCDYSEDVCVAVFTRILPLPNLKALKDALMLFVHHFLKLSSEEDRDIKSSSLSAKRLLSERIRIVETAMKGKS